MHWTDDASASIFGVKAQPGEVIIMQAISRLPWIVPALLACASGLARADVVTDWNVVALNASAVPPNSIVQSRTLAIAHAAVYDAVRAVERSGPGYAVDAQAPSGTSVDAAVAAAAHAALERLAPAAKPMLDAALSVTLAKIPDGQAKTDGVSLGKQVGEQTVALRVGDGADAKVAFNPKPGVGAYVPTPPQALPAILPQWGAVTPFVLRGNVALEWKGPPAPGSAAFARDYEEVKSVGARQSSTRSADQTAAAVFWTVQTAVPWHAAARRVGDQGLVGVRQRQAVCDAVYGHRRFADRGIRREVSAPALAADHRDPRWREHRRRQHATGARRKVGTADRHASASRVPVRARRVFRCGRGGAACVARWRRHRGQRDEPAPVRPHANVPQAVADQRRGRECAGVGRHPLSQLRPRRHRGGTHDRSDRGARFPGPGLALSECARAQRLRP